MPSLPITKILLPVDFSARAEEALRYAVPMAQHFNAELVLLHVLEPLHPDFAMAELPDALASLSQTQRERARVQLAHFVSSDFAGVKVDRRIAEGPPADEILRAAEGTGLVIMPTQGHGRLREFLIGSVTAKVLHDCSRPVLTGVHLGENAQFPDWRVNRILCAIDFGPECQSVLRWGKRLADEFRAEVTVVHAGSNPERAQQVNDCVLASGLKANVLVIPGEPHDVVADTARQARADLVIIGRGSSVGALGRLRAQAYQIVRKSPCPVLSV